MKDKVNEFVDLFHSFHDMGQTTQIVLLAYFHTVEEANESVSRRELERLFAFSGTPKPKNLAQLLSYLVTKGNKLINSDGEFSLRREVIREIQVEVRRLRGFVAAPKPGGGSPFDFGTRTFTDRKVAALLVELSKCYPQECWNACGLLVRIVIERTLDTTDNAVKARSGLRDKISICRTLSGLSKSVREALDGLQGAKIIGDIAAHHSKIILDKNDVDLALPAFRMLIKEVTTV